MSTWSDEDIQQLKKLWKKVKKKEIARRLKKTYEEVERKHIELNLQPYMTQEERMRRWTYEEEIQLNEMYKNGRSIEELVIFFDKTETQVRNKLMNDKIRRRVNKTWTEADEFKLINMWDNTSIENLSEYFGVSKKAIHQKGIKLRRKGVDLKPHSGVWKDGEEEKLIEFYQDYPRRKLAKILGKTPKQVTGKMTYLGLKKIRKTENDFVKKGAKTVWSNEEIEYLEYVWYRETTPYIAEKLGRTKEAVRRKASKLGLGHKYEKGGTISISKIADAFRAKNGGKSNLVSRKAKHWSKKGLNIFKLHGVNVVWICDFWEFAEKNKELFKFSNLEPFALGEEPDWVDKERYNSDIIRPRRWTEYEERLLISKVKSYKFTYDDLSKEFKRSSNSINNKLRRLGVYERPLTRRD